VENVQAECCTYEHGTIKDVEVPFRSDNVAIEKIRFQSSAGQNSTHPDHPSVSSTTRYTDLCDMRVKQTPSRKPIDIPNVDQDRAGGDTDQHHFHVLVKIVVASRREVVGTLEWLVVEVTD
jgi:hypothetical protein